MSAGTNIKQVPIATGASSGIGLCIRKRYQTRLSSHRKVVHDQQPSVDLIMMEGDVGKNRLP